MKSDSIVMAGAGMAGAAMAAVAASSKRATKTVADKVKASAERVGQLAKAAVAAPKAWPHNHAHVNPHYRPRKGGVVYFKMRRSAREKTFFTMQDVGRWMPHNGAREMARRLRQMERANGAA